MECCWETQWQLWPNSDGDIPPFWKLPSRNSLFSVYRERQGRTTRRVQLYMIGIMSVDLHASVIYYQFQKRKCFYFSEVKKKILLMKTAKMVLIL